LNTIQLNTTSKISKYKQQIKTLNKWGTGFMWGGYGVSMRRVLTNGYVADGIHTRIHAHTHTHTHFSNTHPIPIFFLPIFTTHTYTHWGGF